MDQDNRVYQRFKICAMILSFMVVMIHSSYTGFYPVTDNVGFFLDECYTDYISGFAVPAFFMISAIKFYKNYDYSKTLQKYSSRVKSIVIPFFVWNTISVIWAIALSYLPGISKLVSVREKFTFTWENIVGGVLWFKYIHPFWYLGLLIIYTALCPLFYTIIKNKYVGILTVVGLYLLFIFGVFPQTLWPMLQYKTIVYCTAFYLVGALCGKYAYSEMIKWPGKCGRIVAIGLFMASVLLRTIMKDAPVIFIPAILAGSYAIWLFSGTIEIKRSFWHKVINTSFFIYPAHTFVLPCVNKLLFLILPHTSVMCVVNTIGGTLITYVLCVFAALVLQKVCPSVIWSVLNGNRIQKTNY